MDKFIGRSPSVYEKMVKYLIISLITIVVGFGIIIFVFWFLTRFQTTYFRISKNTEISSIIQENVFGENFSCLTYIDGQLSIGMDGNQLIKYKIDESDSSSLDLFNLINSRSKNNLINVNQGNTYDLSSMIICSSIPHEDEKAIWEDYFNIKFKYSDQEGTIEIKKVIHMYICMNTKSNSLYLYISGYFLPQQEYRNRGLLEPLNGLFDLN